MDGKTWNYLSILINVGVEYPKSCDKHSFLTRSLCCLLLKQVWLLNLYWIVCITLFPNANLPSECIFLNHGQKLKTNKIEITNSFFLYFVWGGGMDEKDLFKYNKCDCRDLLNHVVFVLTCGYCVYLWVSSYPGTHLVAWN